MLFSGWNLAFTFVGGIGIISWGLAALLSGTLVSGDRMRANYYTESRGFEGQKKINHAVIFVWNAITFYCIDLIPY